MQGWRGGRNWPKRSRKRTLERCKKIWQVIAVEDCGKYYAYCKLGYNTYDSDVNQCPCCTYVFNLKECDRFFQPPVKNCQEHCPLEWGHNKKGKKVDCCHASSPFMRWEHAKSEGGRKRLARQIVEMCEKELRKYK